METPTTHEGLQNQSPSTHEGLQPNAEFESFTHVTLDQLNKLYNVDMLDITEIAKIYNKNPGEIISDLMKHKCIGSRLSARGYKLYKSSDLYKEICANKKVEKEEKDKKREEKKKKKESFTGVKDSTALQETSHSATCRPVNTYLAKPFVTN